MRLKPQAPETTQNQLEVCALLGWETGRHTIYMFDHGYEYLTIYFDGDDNAVGRLTRRVQFWNWWRLQWNARDAAFLDSMAGREDDFKKPTIEKLYGALHMAEVLASEIAPPTVVYPSDFTTIKMQMA